LIGGPLRALPRIPAMSHLFQPMRIATPTLDNLIVVAPTCQYAADRELPQA
jgi:2,4-dienoyl-CoA reductase-like NADH-dependent reductase (Old Yellow Enzyme family)